MEHLDKFRIPEEAIKRMQQPDFLMNAIDAGQTLQEIIGYSDETMEGFYQIANKLYAEAKHEEAKDAFLFLTTMNPNIYAFWIGLGMSFQMIEEYEEAILAYEYACKLENSLAFPWFHAANCFMLIGNKDLAKSYYLTAKELAQDKAESKEVFTRAENALKKWK